LDVAGNAPLGYLVGVVTEALTVLAGDAELDSMSLFFVINR